MLGCRTGGMIGTRAKGATHGRYVVKHLPFPSYGMYPSPRRTTYGTSSPGIYKYLLALYAGLGYSVLFACIYGGYGLC